MTDTPTQLTDHSSVVFFDGVCTLCSGSMRFILRHNSDQTIRFASLQSLLGREVLYHYGYPVDAYETMLYVEDGELFVKSTAVLKIMNRLTYPWRVLQVFYVLPVGIRDWVYDRVARNRYRVFGKRNHCFVPEKDVLHRFLDL
jgi:predicted DCC family thiol-disulfide oxidoreductase YuxK